MVVQLRTSTIELEAKGGALVPTSTAGRSLLQQIIKRDIIPTELQDIYFPRIVRAGYKLAIINYGEKEN